jgi:hypothetical protein
VETVLDHVPGAIGQPVRPGGQPPAQLGVALQQGHRDAALGEQQSGGHAGDAAADHDRPDRLADRARQVGARTDEQVGVLTGHAQRH